MHHITPITNTLENSNHNREQPTLGNFTKFLMSHNDALILAIYLAEEKEVISPFGKEGLRAYFDKRTKNKDLFV